MNHFQKHPGQVLLVLKMDDDTLDVSPLGEPGFDALMRGSMLAEQYSLQVGVVDATIWSPDEEMVTRFIYGRLDLTIDEPNPFAGLL